MSRCISSPFTFIHKFILPLACVLGLAVFTLEYVQGQSRVPARTPNFGIPIILLIFLAVSIWFSHWLKKVTIDGDSLVVSDYLRSITVPLREIADVTEGLPLKQRGVTIHLKRPTRFGQKIRFIGTYQRFWVPTPHPIVKELLDLSSSDQFRDQ